LAIIAFKLPKLDGRVNLYPRIAGVLLWLLIICVSYSSMVIRVRQWSAVSTSWCILEKKLTMTLVIASLLLLLPVLMFSILLYDGQLEMSFSVEFNIDGASWVLFYANSLVDPILYVMRMPQYRSAVAALFCKKNTLHNGERRVADLPLRDL